MRRKVLGLVSAVLIFTVLLAACGASKSTENVSNSNKAAIEVKDQSDKDLAKSEAARKPVEVNTGDNTGESDGVTGNGKISETSSNIILDQRKIIRNANASLEVESFDKTYSKLESLVEDTGYGYIEGSQVNKEKVYTGSKEKLVSNGTVVLRVDSDKFKKVLNSVKGLGTLLDLDTSTEDVTDKFYDVDSECRLLKYEQSRLEEYLKKITDPDTIFKTESRLTEIRHQIEGLTGTLNKLSNLVRLSTITLNITEKAENPAPEKVVKEKSYTEKLFSGLLGSLGGVGDFFGQLLLVIVEALPVVVVCILFMLLFIFTFKKIIKKYLQNRKKDKNEVV